MKTVLRVLFSMLALAATCLGQTPTVVQSMSGPSSQASPITDYKIPFPNLTLAGNTLVVVTQAGGAATSVTDDALNTYVQAGSTCTNGNAPISWWVAKNTSPARVLDPHWSVAKTFASVAIIELYNVDLTTPIDTMSAGTNPTCNHTTSASITAGSGTPTTTGAIALNFVVQDGTGNPIVKFTNGSSCGGFTTLNPDIVDSIFLQSAITSGACNADATQDASRSYNSSTLFLRPATAGLAPSSSGIRVLKDQHQNFHLSTSTPLTVEWAGTGNLWVLRWQGSGSECLGSSATTGGDCTASADPSDANGNTWTQIGLKVTSAGSGVDQIYYCKACTGSNTNIITLPYAGAASVGTTVHLLDVTNFDTTYTPIEGHLTGTMVAGTTYPGATLAPAFANGLVVGMEGHASNDALAISQGNFNSCIITPTPPTSSVDENNGNFVWYNLSTTSSTQNTWTTSGIVGVWADKMVFFKASATVAGPSTGSLSMSGMGK